MPDINKLFYEPGAEPSGYALVNGSNPYYPYVKAQEAFQTFKGAEKIPLIIAGYLMDMPVQGRYEPADDNSLPRCRFWKYVYHDDMTPLDDALPTPEQKLSVWFDPGRAEPGSAPDRRRGYRLFAANVWGVSQEGRQTTVRITTGRRIPADNFRTEIAVRFLIFTSPGMEYLYNGTTRTEGIEQALIEALHGVAIDGVGWLYYSRANHPDCQTVTDLTDGRENTGRELTMGVTWQG